MQLLSSGDVCKILSTHKATFPRKTLDNWVKQGIVVPVVNPAGTGNHRMFTISQALGLAVGRGLRASGVSFKAAGTVMESLMNASEGELKSLFARGKCYVVILGDEVFPDLLSRKMFEKHMNKVSEETGLFPIAVDAQAVYERILRVLKIEEKQPA